MKLGFLAFESLVTTCDPLREVEVNVGIPAFEPLVTTCDPHYGIGFGGNGHLTRLSKPEHGHDTSCCHYVDKMQCVHNLPEFSGAP
jgi:hypothetical protein